MEAGRTLAIRGRRRTSRALRWLGTTLLVGGSLLTAAGPAAAQDGDGAYAGEVDGAEWSVLWDSGEWDDVDTGEAADLVLEGGSSTVSFIGDALYGGDAADCLDGEVFNALDTSSVLDSEQTDALDLGDQGDGRAYATWDITFLNEEDDQQTNAVTILCQTLEPDASVLIVYHIVPTDELTDDAGAVADLVAGIVIGQSDDTPDPSTAPDDEGTPESDGTGADEDAGTYISPTYGYTLAFPADDWEVEADRTLNTLGRDQLTLLASDSSTRVYFEGSDEWDGNVDDCVTELVDELGIDPEATRPVEVSRNTISDVEAIDDPQTGEAFKSDDSTAAAGYRYEIEFEDGSSQEQFAIVDCHLLDEETGLVLGVSQVGLVDDLENGVRDGVTDITETVEYDGEPIAALAPAPARLD
ncbi:MAG TPA: hypothetical protein VGT61_10785 [Thermomicrobiales bacterium]|jgi:hypothetical protein|nr:hypothetical protein [Thermomicrobiales bacterium]